MVVACLFLVGYPYIYTLGYQTFFCNTRVVTRVYNSILNGTRIYSQGHPGTGPECFGNTRVGTRVYIPCICRVRIYTQGYSGIRLGCFASTRAGRTRTTEGYPGTRPGCFGNTRGRSLVDAPSTYRTMDKYLLRIVTPALFFFTLVLTYVLFVKNEEKNVVGN